jgi:hypothetical protein
MPAVRLRSSRTLRKSQSLSKSGSQLAGAQLYSTKMIASVQIRTLVALHGPDAVGADLHVIMRGAAFVLAHVLFSSE